MLNPEPNAESMVARLDDLAQAAGLDVSTVYARTWP